MTVCIDACSIVDTGGLTHLKEILKQYDFKVHPKINRLIIIASKDVLESLPNNKYFLKKSSFFLNHNRLFRIFYQTFLMDFYLKKNVDVLFSITGDYIGNFKPVIGISQNMLLYERNFWKEIKSFVEKLKLFINHKRQKICFKNAEGIIFISKYAKNYISGELNLENKLTTIINHGLSNDFIKSEKQLKKSSTNSWDRPFKFVYVSTVHVYKNQWNVIEAIHSLRKRGFSISLTLIGPIIYRPSGDKMMSTIKKVDPEGNFITYIPEITHLEMPNYISNHDGIIFASTCENMPNILIESMGSGLPIACSDKMPMPEFLCDGGYYFNADSIRSICDSIVELLNDNDKTRKIQKNLKFIRSLSWEETSKKTFSFIESVK